MKLTPTQRLAMAGSGLFALSSGCAKPEAAAPVGMAGTARIVGIETMVDGAFQCPRPRWTLDLSPVELPGWGGAVLPTDQGLCPARYGRLHRRAHPHVSLPPGAASPREPVANVWRVEKPRGVPDGERRLAGNHHFRQ